MNIWDIIIIIMIAAAVALAVIMIIKRKKQKSCCDGCSMACGCSSGKPCANARSKEQ